MRIAYLLDIFPTITETFISNEIEVVKGMVSEVHVCSLRRPDVLPPHGSSKNWVQTTRYYDIAGQSKTRRLKDAIRLFVRRPAAMRAFLAARRFDRGLQWRMGSMSRLAIEMLDRGVDHIHAHFANDAAESAWCISMLTGIPFSVTTHRYDIVDTPYRYYRELAQGASFVRSISHANARRLEALGVPREKIRIIHCGVDLGLFCGNGARLQTTVDILSVGALIERKGHHLLIQAARAAKDQGCALKIAIVGEGPYRQALEALVARLDVADCVKLLGARSQTEVNAMLADTKIFALASSSEGIPVAAMEAMACELPVVASAIEGMDELISNGETGLLFPPGSVDELTRCLLELIASPVRRRDLGHAARRQVGQSFNLRQEVFSLVASIESSQRA